MPMVLLLVLTVLQAGVAAEANNEADRVVATAGGHTMTVRDIAMAYGLAWFLTNQVATEAELEALAQAEVAEFKADPALFRQGVDLVSQLLGQATQLTNPIEVGLYRMHVGNVFWSAVEQVEPANRGALLNWIYERNPVLAYDRANEMVFTALDGHNAIRYLLFVNGVPEPTAEQLETIGGTVKAVAENYVQMPVEAKQQLAVAGLMWTVVEAQWQRLTAEQKQQMLSQLQQQQQTAVAQPPANQPQTNYENMDPESLRILSEISQMQHMTSMNIIENIGGTGNYWEIVDQPW